MTQLYEDAPKVTISSPPIRQVRVRGWRFTSTPPRRPYWLPYEKSQGEASSRLHEFVLPESVPVVGESSVPASSIAHAPRRTLIPDVSDKLLVDPPSSIHSQETRSPPSWPLPFASVGDHEFVPDDVPGDISAAPMGQPNDRRDEDEVEP
ncbi:uncharacterized protein E5676_scaffold205G00870 [Cucumis melo var. makuwa]|uniref:Envelope-like protein n=1 Tax=Cucumis melo var. makuwa TaxID=1194695 RepID=A0A5A7TDD7_CUCMM|nr:uncharacterized protein E6C27_scaffold6G00150 [Cucumis melo var. makuwa]TYK24316.1 uncharacterized protein E5676_scaffold205G00870 [Cucumis melo var. makuwa]